MNNMRQHYFEPRANLPAKIRRALAVLAIAVPALVAALPAQASTFTVGGSGNTFIVTRDDTTAAETVNYRTVSLSAYAGQHYTAKSGTLTFPAGQSAVTNTVTETTPTADAYKFQTGTSRYYRFELTDAGGFLVTNATRSLTTGTRVTASSAFGAKDLPINAGTITVTDGGYDQAYHSVTVNNYFTAAAPKDYFVAAGAQLRATVTFHAHEKDDGYQYVAIYANTSTSNVDTGAKDGDPGTVSYSRYMAGFTIDGNVSSTWYPYTFPLTSKGHACGEQTHPWSGNSNGNLKQQYFKSNCRAADGRLIIPTDLSSLYVRLNASGNLNDTWYASNVVAHVQAVDSTAPSKLAFSVAPGVRARGNDLFVSVAFSEPVTCSSATLSTTWGKLSYNSGNGSNVLTFKGTISDAASGSLGITNRSGTVKDLAGNLLNGSLNQTSLATLDASHAYAISCDLAGGSASNPTTYTYDSDDIVLANPTRTGYVFDGWSGTGFSGLTNAVTIPARSHGDRAYAAHWTPVDYTVRFDANGGTGTPMPDQSFTYDVATNLAANAFARTGYIFDGWDYAGATYPDGAAVQNLTNENATVTLSAHWTPVAYAITYANATNGVDGVVNANPTSYTIEDGTVYLANPTRTNYFFCGWYGNPDFIGDPVSSFSAADLGERTFYAKWMVVPWPGSGTGADPYVISTREELDAIAEYANAGIGDSRVAYYRLDADIAYDPAVTNGYTPIGNLSFPFSGIFDGNGHTISGISISRPDSGYQGLFGYLCGTVRNLTLADSSIEGQFFIGGIAGRFGSGSIQNCFVIGTTLSGDGTIGAIAGSRGGTLSGNAYHGCAAVVEGSTSASGIGTGNTGDSLDGVWPCYALALAEGVVTHAAPQFSFPVYGTDNSYYAVGQSVTVRGAAGYALANVRVNGSDATDNHNGTFSFAMPAADATVTADVEALPAIPYIDAGGEPQACTNYTVIAGAAAGVTYGENGAEAWCAVTNAVTISGRLYFSGTAHLILCDGATLTVTNDNGEAISANRDLAIYGQTNGTGTIGANGSFSGIRASGDLKDWARARRGIPRPREAESLTDDAISTIVATAADEAAT